MMRCNRSGQVKVTNGALAPKNALLRSYCVQFSTSFFSFLLGVVGMPSTGHTPLKPSRSINTIIEDMGPCQMGIIKTMTTPEIQTFGGLDFFSLYFHSSSSVVFKYNMYRFPETRPQQIRQPSAIYSHLYDKMNSRTMPGQPVCQQIDAQSHTLQSRIMLDLGGVPDFRSILLHHT